MVHALIWTEGAFKQLRNSFHFKAPTKGFIFLAFCYCKSYMMRCHPVRFDFLTLNWTCTVLSPREIYQPEKTQLCFITFFHYKLHGNGILSRETEFSIFKLLFKNFSKILEYNFIFIKIIFITGSMTLHCIHIFIIYKPWSILLKKLNLMFCSLRTNNLFEILL